MKLLFREANVCHISANQNIAVYAWQSSFLEESHGRWRRNKTSGRLFVVGVSAKFSAVLDTVCWVTRKTSVRIKSCATYPNRAFSRVNEERKLG